MPCASTRPSRMMSAGAVVNGYLLLFVRRICASTLGALNRRASSRCCSLVQVAAQFRRRGEGELEREDVLVGQGESAIGSTMRSPARRVTCSHVEHKQIFALAGVARFPGQVAARARAGAAARCHSCADLLRHDGVAEIRRERAVAAAGVGLEILRQLRQVLLQARSGQPCP